jgi:hypothetical protein
VTLLKKIIELYEPKLMRILGHFPSSVTLKFIFLNTRRFESWLCCRHQREPYNQSTGPLKRANLIPRTQDIKFLARSLGYSFKAID